VKAYSKELYGTASIKTHGWIDVAGPDFASLIRQCVAVVYPSCSEGCAGSVITCLHGGLIPIVSKESGVDVEGFGILLQNVTVDEIKAKISTFANLSTDELRVRSKKAWEFAQTSHTREAFAKAYKQVVANLLDIQGQG
jgi:glycosyltransferase involved in cell wall biosynthesis